MTPRSKKQKSESPLTPDKAVKKETIADKAPAVQPAEQVKDELAPLKAKLRHKYFLLRNDSLNYFTREALLNYVCRILGMNLPELEHVLEDL